MINESIKICISFFRSSLFCFAEIVVNPRHHQDHYYLPTLCMQTSIFSLLALHSSGLKRLFRSFLYKFKLKPYLIRMSHKSVLFGHKWTISVHGIIINNPESTLMRTSIKLLTIQIYNYGITIPGALILHLCPNSTLLC